MVILVVMGQAIVAYLLVDRIVMRRLYGLPTEDLKEVKVEAPISDEPERVYSELGMFILNPADTTHVRLVRMNVALGVAPAEVQSELEVQTPRVKDAIIRIFTSKVTAEMDDPEDREFIKDEIRFALNKMLTKGEVLKVYFTDFTIQ
jgi:flagellar basal body-associated protein FliL